MKKTLFSLSLILIAALALTGCYEWPDPIFNPDEEEPPVPTITGVSATTVLGGMESLTITGTGFGTDATKIIVHFKKGSTTAIGRTLSTTDTEVVVEAPALYSDSLEIWLDKIPCWRFAKYTENLITIEQGVKAIPIITTKTLDKVAINENNDIYVAQGGSKDMLLIEGDSISTVVGASFSDSKPVLGMKAKGSSVYYSLLYRFAKYDGTIERVDVNSPKLNCNDFDFANNGKIYFTADNNIFSLNHDLSTQGTPVTDLNYLYKKCQVYNDKMYVTATYDGDDSLRTNEKLILAYPINTDGSLGTEEVVINWTEDFAGSEISDITFDANGSMYVATKTSTPIYVIEPVAGSYADGNIELLYPVLLNDKVNSMSWEVGSSMAIITEDGDGIRTVYTVPMLVNPCPSYMP